jgi:hypothetical protein
VFPSSWFIPPTEQLRIQFTRNEGDQSIRYALLREVLLLSKDSVTCHMYYTLCCRKSASILSPCKHAGSLSGLTIAHSTLSSRCHCSAIVCRCPFLLLRAILAVSNIAILTVEVPGVVSYANRVRCMKNASEGLPHVIRRPHRLHPCRALPRHAHLQA